MNWKNNYNNNERPIGFYKATLVRYFDVCDGNCLGGNYENDVVNAHL